MELAILAGGLGTRLGNLTKAKPKPLMGINKTTFLEKLILNNAKYNVKKIYILCGYKGYLIKKKYHKKFINGVPIECFIEKKKLGTAGALYQLKKKIKKNFFLINGDTYVDINLNKYSKLNLKDKIGYIFLTKKNANKNQPLSLDKKKNIIQNKKSNLISTGFYYFNKKILKNIKYKETSLEKEILPYYFEKKKIKGIIYNKYFIDIGTPVDLRKFKEDFKKKLYCLILDRDGVLNVDRGYTHKIKDFKFKKGIIPLIKKLNLKYIFIVTNQSGIARGYYDENIFNNFIQHIKKKLSIHNIYINDTEYCPHHIDGSVKKFKKNCNCRKPKNGMFTKLNKKWDIDCKKSIMIGNDFADYIFAKKSSIKYLTFRKNLFKKIDNIKNYK
tara:strand:+ start:4161 stop:5318 length:1158 start_codon:yes stop_codon:yes gene_type:complete